MPVLLFTYIAGVYVQQLVDYKWSLVYSLPVHALLARTPTLTLLTSTRIAHTIIYTTIHTIIHTTVHHHTIPGRCPSADNSRTAVNETDCSVPALISEGLGTTANRTVGEFGNLCYVDCANRGICDYSTGTCVCFEGQYGTDCSLQVCIVLVCVGVRLLFVGV